MKKISKISFVVLMIFISANIYGQSDWIAPISVDGKINPLKNNQNAIKQGKSLFQQLCAVCHGDKGKGDGIASAALNPMPANFMKEKFYSQSDGAIYWKLTEGRPPMASYKEALSETQRWQLVNYIKTLKK